MRKTFSVVLLILLLLFASQAFGVSKEITLAWDHDGVDLTGFKIFYGTSAGVYSTPVDVGMATPCVDLSITPEEFCYKLAVDIPEDAITTFYITATAYDAESNESAYATPEVNAVYDYEKPPVVTDLDATFDKVTSTLSFTWTYEDVWLPKIEKWSLWESDTSGGTYGKVVDIPYDSAVGPPYTTDVVIPSETTAMTKYYVLVAHRGADNNDVASGDSNEVAVTIDKMPPKSPFEFKIKIR